MKRRAFTLVELLVATAVVGLLSLLISQVISLSLRTWNASRDRVGAFQDARTAFGKMQATLGRAVLNSRLEYADAGGQFRSFADGNFTATQVLRASDLHFVSGPAADLLPAGTRTTTPGNAIFFQAPLGFTDNSSFAGARELLNSTGFFVEFGPDPSKLPAFLQGLPGRGGARFRLKQWVQPAERNRIYTSTSATDSSSFYDWFRGSLPSSPGGSTPAGEWPVRILAEDVFALFFVPAVSPSDEEALGGPISRDYQYDSRAWQNRGGLPVLGQLKGRDRHQIMRNQLPPMVKVAALVLERRDADRLQNLHGENPPPEVAIPSDLFQDSTKLDADLAEFENRLLSLDPPIRPRIFRANIPLQAAKWSNQ